MNRNIITIDELKCNGCAKCIKYCTEGALTIKNGKITLIDSFCVGNGECIDICDKKALKLICKDANEYNEYSVVEKMLDDSKETLKLHIQQMKNFAEGKFFEQAIEYLEQRSYFIPNFEEYIQNNCNEISRIEAIIHSIDLRPQLNNWPIQLELIDKDANFLQNSDVIIAGNCVPFSYPEFKNTILKDKILMMFCPKFDDVDKYIEKLIYIFKNKNIKSVTIAHTEIQCCEVLETIIKNAIHRAKSNVKINNYTFECVKNSMENVI